MNRQQAFEAIYAKQHDVPAESLVQYRFESKDGYSLPGIASHYRTYCMTLDSLAKPKESRRSSFESWILSPQQSDGDTDLILRDNDGEYYSAPAEERWEIYNAAIDSLEIELPEWFDPDGGGYKAVWLDLLHDALTAAGVKYK